MPDNFVYLGVYFVASKLYFNALLTSLNVRRTLRANYIATTSMELTASSAGVHSTLVRSPNPRRQSDQIVLKPSAPRIPDFVVDDDFDERSFVRPKHDVHSVPVEERTEDGGH
ncbi:hypothetical protein PUNSTDRAFT_121633 [Punctularia strigosozonata HHB-11173 SS5]|uniref:uncharacterized protein n=1 Tax=Punctularia strigosozonata (strain HHB-11173) TaxID=741275 RepID=UPI0004417FC9|nr:uncharacterized protein PUNSTDRAFT_121633 [Punctularia strigosozonata HHB-11173 SS5]EIN06405.1 hypothetical protein PUNSTDRAFT_121633 [Punctularia strigosozonata HHB-11173 SS5]